MRVCCATHVPGGTAERQYLYWTDPIAEPPVSAGAFAVSGLVELLPVTNHIVLTTERSFSIGAPGTRKTIRLCQVRLSGAQDISDVDSLPGQLDGVRPLDKELVSTSTSSASRSTTLRGWPSDRTCREGRRALLLVSDSNFNAAGFARFLLFAVYG